MQSARVKTIVSLIFLAQLLSACSGNAGNTNTSQPNSNQNRNTVSANDKAEELGMLVVLPIEPEETVWREDPGEGNAKKLTAVLKYPVADAAKLSTLIEKSPPLSASINTETWFPAELIAQSDLSGDDTLKGDSFAAVDFYQAPYSEGTITRIEGTNYFILELHAK
jgi:hypothetical protein